MNKKLFILCLLGLSLHITACSPDRQTSSSTTEEGAPADDIIGGRVVKSSDPISSSTVAVYDTNAKALCTGSLIKDNVILTAAHCIGEEPQTMVAIFAGDLHKPKNVVKVVKTAVHPKWKTHQNNSTGTGDMALIFLAAPAPAGYEPAKILPENEKLEVSAKVILAGYGISDCRSACLLKGRLFYPWGANQADWQPQAACPTHWTGWWMPAADFPNRFADESLRWLPLPKAHWLTPLEPGVRIGDTLTAAALLEQLAPELDNRATAVVGLREGREVERGFLTPSNWPDRINPKSQP